MEDYNLLGKAERLLLDKVLLKNRINSGSIAVCEGNAFLAPSFIFWDTITQTALGIQLV